MIGVDARLGGLLERFIRKLISADELARELGLVSSELAVFGARLVHEAERSRDPAKLGSGLMLCGLFGFSGVSLEFLHGLIGQDWHQMHERVVDAVLTFRDPASVDVLWSMAKAHLPYRSWDDVESLEVKCTYGLWKLETAPAVGRLADLAASAGPRTRRTAVRLLRELARNGTSVEVAAVSALAGLQLPVQRGAGEEDEE